MGNKEARERKNRRKICYVWKMWESSTQMLQKKVIEKLNGTCRGSLLGTCLRTSLNGNLDVGARNNHAGSPGSISFCPD